MTSAYQGWYHSGNKDKGTPLESNLEPRHEPKPTIQQPEAHIEPMQPEAHIDPHIEPPPHTKPLSTNITVTTPATSSESRPASTLHTARPHPTPVRQHIVVPDSAYPANLYQSLVYSKEEEEEEEEEPTPYGPYAPDKTSYGTYAPLYTPHTNITDAQQAFARAYTVDLCNYLPELFDRSDYVDFDTPQDTAPPSAAAAVAKDRAGTDAALNDSWNQRFMKAFEMNDGVRKYALIAQLSVDFVDVATMLAKVIISEQHMPMDMRTVKPIPIGGMAGGSKLVVRGILFKLTADPKLERGPYLYGGHKPVYEFASKANGADLRGANAYFQISVSQRQANHIPRVHVPVMAIVEYRGFRVTAIPWLRLKSDVGYGSADGGRHVFASTRFAPFMEKSARILHLAQHSVMGQRLCSAGDVEGRIGMDGRAYLIDLARTMPPEHPEECSHLPAHGQTVFYRLLRPEFLQTLKRNGMPPLSSDGLTGWARDQPDAILHNRNVRIATRYLTQTIIPEYARQLDGIQGDWRAVREKEKREAEQKRRKSRIAAAAVAELTAREARTAPAPARGTIPVAPPLSDAFIKAMLFSAHDVHTEDKGHTDADDDDVDDDNVDDAEDREYRAVVQRRRRQMIQRQQSNAQRHALAGHELHERIVEAVRLRNAKLAAQSQDGDEAEPSVNSIVDIARKKRRDAAKLRLPVSQDVHGRGVNIRHIGLLRSLVKNKVHRETLLIAIVARTLKNILRLWQREAMRSMRAHEPSEFVIRSTVVGFLNLTIGARPGSNRFWSKVATHGVTIRFGDCALTDNERSDLFRAVKPIMYRVVTHLLRLMAIRLSADSAEEFKRSQTDMLNQTGRRRQAEMQNDDSDEDGDQDATFQFSIVDFNSSDAIPARVKHLAVLDLAMGKLLAASAEVAEEKSVPLGKALKTSAATALRLLKLAQQRFESVLRSFPQHIDAISETILAGKRAMARNGQVIAADHHFVTRLKHHAARLVGLSRYKLLLGCLLAHVRDWRMAREAYAEAKKLVVENINAVAHVHAAIPRTKYLHCGGAGSHVHLMDIRALVRVIEQAPEKMRAALNAAALAELKTDIAIALEVWNRNFSRTLVEVSLAVGWFRGVFLDVTKLLVELEGPQDLDTRLNDDVPAHAAKEAKQLMTTPSNMERSESKEAAPIDIAHPGARQQEYNQLMVKRISDWVESCIASTNDIDLMKQLHTRNPSLRKYASLQHGLHALMRWEGQSTRANRSDHAQLTYDDDGLLRDQKDVDDEANAAAAASALEAGPQVVVRKASSKASVSTQRKLGRSFVLPLKRKPEIALTAEAGFVVLCRAAAAGDFDEVHVLRELGVGLDDGYVYGRFSKAFYGRLRDGFPVLTKSFLEGYRRTEAGQTALMTACSRRHVSMVKNLLRMGADPHVLDRNGYSAVMHMCESPYTSTVNKSVLREEMHQERQIFRALVKAGVDLEVQSRDNGMTSLHLATLRLKNQMVSLLMSRAYLYFRSFVFANLQDAKGQTALDILHQIPKAERENRSSNVRMIERMLQSFESESAKRYVKTAQRRVKPIADSIQGRVLWLEKMLHVKR